jgi:hypothetical protein
MELSTENIAFFGILLGMLVLVWALVRANVVIANLVPVPLVQELIKSAVNTALEAAARKAATTETQADDELIAMIRVEVAKVLGPAMAAQAVQNKQILDNAVSLALAKQDPDAGG